MKFLKNGVFWVVMILIISVVVSSAVRAWNQTTVQVKTEDAMAKIPTVWTPEEMAKLQTAMTEGTQKLNALGDVFAGEVRDCAVAKVVAAFPGGPAEMIRSGQTNTFRTFGMAGDNCAEQVTSRYVKSTVWKPEGRPVMVGACTLKAGESYRKVCECMVDQATKYFAQPGDFYGALTKSPEELSFADNKRLKSIQRACAKHSPE